MASRRANNAGWTEFSQKESLTTRLHNILEDYAPGVAIFNEFVQNADDAGARRVILALDRRRFDAG